jgi:hypothetical protein
MNAMPPHRQEYELLLNGFLQSRQTMANWMIHASERWLEPLYERMKVLMLEENLLHTGETVLQALKEQGRKSRTRSYMWPYRTSGRSSGPAVIYEYQETRSSSHPKRFLSGFNGYLHTDGYSGCHTLPPNIKAVGCWAHLRRRLVESVAPAPPEAREGLPSQKGLDFCSRLSALKREFKKLNPEERCKERLERSEPLMDEFYSWANNVGALPKPALGGALHYVLEQKPCLENILLDGRLESSNNRAERSIKPFAIDRKNWIFSATPKGAKASPVIYSAIGTAKENGLRPFEYLKYLFGTIHNMTDEPLDPTLPWSPSLTIPCKMG